ncbi:MAG: diacylglycerol kinase [Treponema sp.]|jgi:diacylglycerol kinase family enzyme|nr:diacylglycerol kinase [Treponema sp.]
MDLSFVQSLTGICERSLIAPGRPLHCTIIVNPAAGGFTIPARRTDNLRILGEYLQKAQSNPQRPIHKTMNVVLTEDKDSAGDTIRLLIKRAEKDPDPFYLIISAGGDGTHSEIMYALYGASPGVRSNIALLRFPMGTGNDGVNNATLEDSLDMLIKPVHVELASAVQLTTSPDGPACKAGPYLAFNILSAGLDAFVTRMTNKMKGRVPGDSYKLWVDIAALFYGCFYKVDYLDVRALDGENREVLSLKEKMLLLAMGVSGNRTYGSQQKILPNEKNVCGIKQMPLRRKMVLKKQVALGKHADNPEVVNFNARRIEFSGRHPILAQMDGETILLQPEDFPAAMELTPPVIPLLKLNSN